MAEYIPLQAAYADDPWRVCVVCQLLNLTSRQQVAPMLPPFFDTWGDPATMAEATHTAVREAVKPLGLHNRRAKLLRDMSREWVTRGNEWTPQTREDVESLPGCGTYAADAVEIFVWGQTPEETPSDAVLAEYLANRG